MPCILGHSGPLPPLLLGYSPPARHHCPLGPGGRRHATNKEKKAAEQKKKRLQGRTIKKQFDRRRCQKNGIRGRFLWRAAGRIFRRAIEEHARRIIGHL